MPISTVVPKKLDWPEVHLAFFPAHTPWQKLVVSAEPTNRLPLCKV